MRSKNIRAICTCSVLKLDMAGISLQPVSCQVAAHYPTRAVWRKLPSISYQVTDRVVLLSSFTSDIVNKASTKARYNTAITLMVKVKRGITLYTGCCSRKLKPATAYDMPCFVWVRYTLLVTYIVVIISEPHTLSVCTAASKRRRACCAAPRRLNDFDHSGASSMHLSASLRALLLASPSFK